MTQKFKVFWDRSDYGHVIIEAHDKEEAQELFESGEYDEEKFVIKNGNIEVTEVIKA